MTEIIDKKKKKKSSGRAGASKFPAYYRDSVRWAMLLYARREGKGNKALVNHIEEKLPIGRNFVAGGERQITADVLKRFFRGGDTDDQKLLIMTEFIDIVLPEYSKAFTEKGCSTKFGDLFSKYVSESEPEYFTQEIHSGGGYETAITKSIVYHPVLASVEPISSYEDSKEYEKLLPAYSHTLCYLEEERIIFIHLRPLAGTHYLNTFLIAYDNPSWLFNLDLKKIREDDVDENILNFERITSFPIMKKILENMKNISEQPVFCKARGLSIRHNAKGTHNWTGILVGDDKVILPFERNTVSRTFKFSFMGINGDPSYHILAENVKIGRKISNFSDLTFAFIESDKRAGSLPMPESTEMAEFFDKLFWLWV